MTHDPYALGSLHIMEDSSLLDAIQDWSGCRSIPRAMRRIKKHPQRMKIIYRPKTEIFRNGSMLVMHPATAARLRAETARRSEEAIK